MASPEPWEVQGKPYTMGGTGRALHRMVQG